MRLSVLFLPLLALPAAAFAAQPVTGRWITDDGKAEVTIGNCGSTVCGRISKILAPTPKGPPVDENNPDPRLRTRPVQGLMVLTGFKQDGDEWRGRIYSPEEGKSYHSIMQRTSADKIKVKGCVAMFCKTQVWNRAK